MAAVAAAVSLRVTAIAENDAAAKISFFEAPKTEINVQCGTEKADIGLPVSLSATMEDGSKAEVPVSWDDGGSYKKDTAGEYTFSATVGKDYIMAEAPLAVVTVEDKTKENEPEETAKPAVENKVADKKSKSKDESTKSEPTPVTTPSETQAVAAFDETPIVLEVKRGTSVDDVCAKLPKTLKATDKNGNDIDVPVTWKAPEDDYSESMGMDTYTNESLYGYGPWSFTAVLSQKAGSDGELPVAHVSIPDCNEIKSFCGISSDGLLMKFPVLIGHNVELGDIRYTGAIMADGGYKNVPITFSGSYNNKKVGTYDYQINVTGGYTGKVSARAEIIVEDFR